MGRRLFNKQTIMLTFSFLMMAAFIVIWSDSQQLYNFKAIEKSTAPHWFAIDLANIQMSKEGLPKRQAFAEKMLHYDQHNTTLLEKPRLTLFGVDNRQPWVMTANKGIAYHGKKLTDITLLYLEQKVNLMHYEEPSQKLLQMNTEEMRLYPLLHHAFTHKFVTITEPGQTLQGVGMEVYFNTGVLTLLSEVASHYEIPR